MDEVAQAKIQARLSINRLIPSSSPNRFSPAPHKQTPPLLDLDTRGSDGAGDQMPKHLKELCDEQVNSNPLIFQQQDALAGLFGQERPAEPGESVRFPERPPLPEPPENERGQWVWSGSDWEWFGRTDRRRSHGGGVLPTGRWRSSREEKFNGAGSGEFVPWWRLDLQLEGIERRKGRASQWAEGNSARRTMEDVRAQTLRAGDLRRWDVPAWLSDFGFHFTGTERAVLGAVLYCHDRQSGGLYDSQVAVAARLRVSERSIRNALWGRCASVRFGTRRRPGLVERGLVRVTQTWAPGRDGRPSDKGWLILRVGPELESMAEMAAYEKPKGARPPRGSGITRVIARKYMALVRRYVKQGVYARTHEAWAARRAYEAKSKARAAGGDCGVPEGGSGAVPAAVIEPGRPTEPAEAPVAAVERPVASSAPIPSRNPRAREEAQASPQEVRAISQSRQAVARKSRISPVPNSSSFEGARSLRKPEKLAENPAPVGGGGSYRTPPLPNGRLPASARRGNFSCGKLPPTPENSMERPQTRPSPSRHDTPLPPSTTLSAWIDHQTATKGSYGPSWASGVVEDFQPSASSRDRETERSRATGTPKFFDPYAADRKKLALRAAPPSKRRKPDTSKTEQALARLRTRRDAQARSLEQTVVDVLERNPELGAVLGDFLNPAEALGETSQETRPKI
ncbi:MAG: hypothetical protein B7733_18690 [Myxococcales bacterium FL481]|nr:MAG: hypothetical protein B7733_18690 [Myxococcales bacterium FL481]